MGENKNQSRTNGPINAHLTIRHFNSLLSRSLTLALANKLPISIL